MSISPWLPCLTSLQDSQGGRLWLGQGWEVSALTLCDSPFPCFNFQLHTESLKCHTLFFLTQGILLEQVKSSTCLAHTGQWMKSCEWKVAAKWLGGQVIHGFYVSSQMLATVGALIHVGLNLQISCGGFQAVWPHVAVPQILLWKYIFSLFSMFYLLSLFSLFVRKKETWRKCLSCRIHQAVILMHFYSVSLLGFDTVFCFVKIET